MNTNATAQMVTHGGKGCMKAKPDTDQIAAEAADDFDRYLSNGVPDYYIMSEEDKASLKDIIKAAIEKATEPRPIQFVQESRAAHESGQDESKAKRTARAIRSIAERAGLKITDDVELAWRDAILYALPAAHASEAKLPRDWNKDLPVITHLTPPAHASEPMHCPHCNASFLPPKT